MTNEELNRALHEALTGGHVHDWAYSPPTSDFDTPLICSGCDGEAWSVIQTDERGIAPGRCPEYADDWDAMGELIEAMDERGFRWSAARSDGSTEYLAVFAYGQTLFHRYAATVPLAVARAALAALDARRAFLDAGGSLSDADGVSPEVPDDPR